MSFYLQSPNQKSNYKSPGSNAFSQYQLMQSTAAGSRGFEPRETVFSLQSSQPLRYSSTQYQQSYAKDQEYQHQMSISKLQGSTSNLQRKQVSVERVQQPVQNQQVDDVRERIINSYKDEIKMHCARERDYQHLEALIADLARRSKLLEGSLSDSQREYEERLNTQTKTINHHQGDIEGLKKSVFDKLNEGAHIQDEIAGLKEEVELQNTEIYKTTRDLEGMRQYNDQLKRESEFVQSDIFNAQDQRKKQQNVIYQLKNEMRYKEKEVEEQKAKLAVLEKENLNLVDRTKHMNELVDNKVMQIDRTCQKLDATHRDLADLQSSINAIDIDINEVERMNDRHLELQKKMLRQKDSEIVRGQDFAHTMKERECQNKDADMQIEILRKDLDSVRYSNDALLDRNHELKQELDSLQGHSDLLTTQNRDLQRELDDFVETDEVVRRNLDRKDKVYMIRSKVDEVIKKSMVDLSNKSPSRGRSPANKSQYQTLNSDMHTTQVKRVFLGDSMNTRGSPLRRQHFDH